MAIAVEAFTAYMNARVRGMKRALMSSAELEVLLDRANAPAMAEALLSSSYEQEMADALTHSEGAKTIEEAVTGHLSV